MPGIGPGSWAVDPSEAGAREVAPGLWRLRLPASWPGMGHANAYAITGPDGIVLVDTGPGGHPTTLEALRRAVAEAGFALADVSELVLTHAHVDHLGLAGDVAAESGARVWLHPAFEHHTAIVADPDGRAAWRAANARRGGVPASQLHAFSSVEEEVEGAGPIPATTPLVPGVAVPTALGDLTVLEAPGHAPSQVVLRLGDGAIVADLLCSVPMFWMDVGWTPDPLAEWLASLDRLPALDVAYPGHGRPIIDVAAVVQAHRDGLHALVDAVRARPETESAWAVVEALHGPVEGLTAVARFAEVAAAMTHLGRL